MLSEQLCCCSSYTLARTSDNGDLHAPRAFDPTLGQPLTLRDMQGTSSHLSSQHRCCRACALLLNTCDVFVSVTAGRKVSSQHLDSVTVAGRACSNHIGCTLQLTSTMANELMLYRVTKGRDREIACASQADLG